MKLVDCTAYLGPNIMALRPCVRVVLEASSPSAVSAEVCAGAERLLRAVLPAGAIMAPVFSARTASQLFLEAALALQSSLGCPTRWGRAAALSGHLTEVAFEVMRPLAAREIAECALALLDAAVDETKVEAFSFAYERMRAALALQLRHYFIFDRQQTAARMGVPFCEGFGLPRSTVRLGQGRHTRRLAPGYFCSTSNLAKNVAGDKGKTYAALAAAGLPIARQRVAYNEEQAVRGAAALGYPVVLKPVRGSRGRGVAVNLRDAQEVRAAYGSSAQVSPDVVVETYLRGEDYRLLVIDGAVVAAVRRPLPSVVGDGEHSVAELIAAANRDEGRDGLFLYPMVIDAEVERSLSDQGLAADAVVAAGRRVTLRRAASPESMAIDVTDTVHPDNRDVAVAAAKACGLDIAGIDFVSADIAESWRINGGGIVEVNAGPALDLHMYPQGGSPRDLSWRLIRRSVPARSAGRIPTVMVSGYRNKRAAVDGIAGLLALLGFCPGVVGDDDEAVKSFDYEGDTAARVVALLANEDIGSAVFAAPLRVLALEGAPTASTTISVLTDDIFPIEPELAVATHAPDVLARVQTLAVDIACAAVVIDGTRPALRAEVSRRPAAQVGYVWAAKMAGDTAPLAAHLQAGGFAVVEEILDDGEWLVVCRSSQKYPLAKLSGLHASDARYVERFALLVATAVAVGLGVPMARLALALRTASSVPDGLTSLRVNPFDGPPMASCDPRDEDGLRQLATYATLAATRTWLIVAAETWTLDCVGALVRVFEPLTPYWYCVGPERQSMQQRLREHGVSPQRVQARASVEQAVATISVLARSDDVVALLDLDAASRRRWQGSAPDLPRLQNCDVQWNAAELADIFDGAWVGGPDGGWGAQGVAWGPAVVVAGDLAIIPGEPDQPAQLAGVEAAIMEAFDRGAVGVVAPMRPIDLPRWRSLLVCDDTTFGLERLARAARARFAGPVLALSCADSVATAVTLSAALAQQGLSLFLDTRADEGDVGRATQLALARMPPAAVAALYPVAWDGVALGLLRPTHWLVDLSAVPDGIDERLLFDILPAACKIHVLDASLASGAISEQLVALLRALLAR